MLRDFSCIITISGGEGKTIDQKYFLECLADTQWANQSSPSRASPTVRKQTVSKLLRETIRTIDNVRHISLPHLTHEIASFKSNQAFNLLENMNNRKLYAAHAMGE